MSEALFAQVDPDVTRAETPPGSVYGDAVLHGQLVERVIARGWQLAPDPDTLEPPSEPDRVGMLPFALLPGCLDEPLLLTRDRAGSLSCISNVCSHRGKLVAEMAGAGRTLRCGYHGRQFAADGRLVACPGFEGARGFPSPEADLSALSLERWGPLAFTSLRPAMPFSELLAPFEEHVGFLPWREAKLDPAGSVDYEIDANWMLYCENYLEGFHVPFVHPTLARSLNLEGYRYELRPWGSLQVGIAADGAEAFELPAGHPDHGRRVGGYYAFLFPNTALNFYPWGISVNVVTPLDVGRTRIGYRSYVLDETRRSGGAGSGLDQVEMEDQAVVRGVARGVRSRLYQRGRYAPRHEVAVHQFHRLLAELTRR